MKLYDQNSFSQILVYIILLYILYYHRPLQKKTLLKYLKKR